MTKHELSLDRRRLFGLATAGAAFGLAPAAGRAQGGATILVAGEKFTADGRVAPFAGNTVICHLPQQGPDNACFKAMLEGYRQIPVESGLRRVAMLPPSSYHMTVFSGANDRTRSRGEWPTYVPLEAPMLACDAAVADRVSRLRLNVALPIRMRVAPDQGPLIGDALQIKLVPFDDPEAEKLARARRALTEAFSLRVARREPYYFHISMGYALGTLSPAEARDAQDVVDKWARLVARSAPQISFGAPELCTFEDMFHFERVMYVG